VDHCQDGTDDCRDADVSVEQLKELLETVNKVLAGKTKPKRLKLAKELLPVQSGFFFGSTEYDEYYFGDLKETKEILEKVLAADLDGWDLQYHSSW
jgi:hypothetical protein